MLQSAKVRDRLVGLVARVLKVVSVEGSARNRIAVLEAAARLTDSTPEVDSTGADAAC